MNLWNHKLLRTVDLFVALVILGAPYFTLIDSPWFNQFYPKGRNIADGIMLFSYCLFLLTARKKLFWLILLMTTVSFFVEVFGALILKIYEYRLHDLPMYIPLGHAVVYSCAYYLSRNQFVWMFHETLEKALRRIAFCLSITSLVFLNDIAGFGCYLLFLALLKNRKKPLFYLCLFPLVFYLEFCGTTARTWSYYYVLGNHPYFPPTTVTPSGVAGLYMVIDLVSNSIYFYSKKIKKQLCKFKKSYIPIGIENTGF